MDFRHRNRRTSALIIATHLVGAVTYQGIPDQAATFAVTLAPVQAERQEPAHKLETEERAKDINPREPNASNAGGGRTRRIDIMDLAGATDSTRTP